MDPIQPDMKVADVIERHPETTSAFFDYDCPDMRSGFFRMMAQVMSVRSAVWIHGISLKELMADLNEVATGEKPSRGPATVESRCPDASADRPSQKR